ncbi:unnamed protein product [Chondrus crispus]|uniref:peptidylprolyl isomerase n=1 Tax=Chondrus crispus TaxID=2769 RepID=R7Q214_CHOCR|nr:unnamed protein product [Chondrus crispus]CDF32089.1 unnamed protein product [Chondrus crispus]|eukprot:XP_005711754.1 unnamed protein product [Chondrus crispus]
MAPLGFVGAPASSFLGRELSTRAKCSSRPAHARRLRMGLQVKTAPLPNSQVSIEISVGKEECSAAWDSVVRDVTKKATIDGFRKGTAPKQIVINQVGKERIKAGACEAVIEKSIQKALKDSGLQAIGQAEVDGGVETVISNYDPKSPLNFKIKIDVWPEAKFTESYDNMAVEAEEAPFEEALIDKALEDMRKKQAFSVLAPEGTTASLGQILAADMVGYYKKDDGTRGDKLPEIADGKSIEINMTEGQYMAGFVEGLIGIAVGETRDVNVAFPENNPRPELAGLKAIFEVTCHAVKDNVLPELNDDFAQQVSEEKTLEEFRDTIRARLGVETEAAQEKNINAGIDNKLASIVEVDLPESLVENQVKNKFANMLSSFKDNGMSDDQVKAMVTKENFELYKKRAKGNVEKNLKVNFAVSKIAKEKDIKIDAEEVENQIALVRAELKGQEMEEEKIRDQVEAQLERDLVLKYIKETATVTLVKKEEGKSE